MDRHLRVMRNGQKFFLTEMQKRDVPIDFFSWHIYCTKPHHMTDKAERIKKLLTENGYDIIFVNSRIVIISRCRVKSCTEICRKEYLFCFFVNYHPIIHGIRVIIIFIEIKFTGVPIKVGKLYVLLVFPFHHSYINKMLRSS